MSILRMTKLIETPIIDVLKMLPEDVSRRAILNYIRFDAPMKAISYPSNTSIPAIIATAIDRSMKWSETPEGNEYWLSIYSQLESVRSLDSVRYPHTESINDHV